MDRGRIRLALIIIVLLLASAVAGTWVMEQRENNENMPGSQGYMTPAPVQTAAPEEGGNEVVFLPESGVSEPPVTATPEISPEPTPEATPEPTPEPTPSPTPSPSPTPVPTPSPVPSGVTLASGSFRSDTGVGLNLAGTWTALTVDESAIELKVSLGINSYSLHAAPSGNAVVVTVNGQTAAMGAPAINYDGDVLSYTEFGTVSYKLHLPVGDAAEISVGVKWFFGGSYSGTQLDVIEASATAYVNR